MAHPVVPVYRNKPELPHNHRSTTGPYTESKPLRPVVGAEVGPELPLGQQSLGGGVRGGTTALNTGSTGLSRQTGTSVPPPVYHRTRYRRESPLSGTWSGGKTGTTGQRYNRSMERYYRHGQNCTGQRMGNLSLLERRVYGGCKECVREVIHPIPSDVDSLLIVRISYDQRNKNVGNSVFDLFRIEGRPNRLAPHNVYLRKLWRTISPHVCCHHHQNSKAEDALTEFLSSD